MGAPPNLPKFKVVNSTAGQPFGSLFNDDPLHRTTRNWGDWGLTMHGDPYQTGFGVHVFNVYGEAAADGSSGFALFINEGDGTWVLDTRFPVQSYCRAALFVDLDRDGVEEICTACDPDSNRNGVFNVWKLNAAKTGWTDVAKAWGIDPSTNGPSNAPLILSDGLKIQTICAVDLGKLGVSPWTPNGRLSLILGTWFHTLTLAQVWTNYGSDANPAFQEEAGPRGLGVVVPPATVSPTAFQGAIAIYGIRPFDLGDGPSRGPTFYAAGEDANYWARPRGDGTYFDHDGQGNTTIGWEVNARGLNGFGLPNLPAYAFDAVVFDQFTGNPAFLHAFETALGLPLSTAGYKGSITLFNGGGNGNNPARLAEFNFNTSVGVPPPGPVNPNPGSYGSGQNDLMEFHQISAENMQPQQAAWGSFTNDGFIDMFLTVPSTSASAPFPQGKDIFLKQGLAYGTADDGSPNTIPFQWGLTEQVSLGRGNVIYTNTGTTVGEIVGVAGPAIEYVGQIGSLQGGGGAGSAIAEDWNKDGKMDLLVGYNTATAAGPWNIFQNVTDPSLMGHFIGVIPRGPMIIGAKITITDSNGQTWQDTMDDGGGWKRQNPRQWHFGLGTAGGNATVTVKFPDGVTQTATLPVDHWYICNETGGGPVPADLANALLELDHVGGNYPLGSFNQIENDAITVHDRVILYIAEAMRNGGIKYGDATFQTLLQLANSYWSPAILQHHFGAGLPANPALLIADDSTVVNACAANAEAVETQINALNGISTFDPTATVNATLLAQTAAIKQALSQTGGFVLFQ